MELRNYFEIIQKKSLSIVIMLAIIVGATVFFTLRKGETFTGSIMLYAVSSPQQELDSESVFEYGNYYNLKANESLIMLISTWFYDPAYLTQIFDGANLDLPDVNLNKYSKILTTKKLDSMALNVSISNPEHDYVSAVLNSVKKFASNNVELWKQQGAIKNISIFTSDPFIVREKPPIVLNTILALMVGLFFSITIVLFQEYLKPTK